MNGLKPMLLMVVLGGILYVVYVVLNRGPAPDPPPGISKDWAKLPEIQLGTAGNNSNGGSPNWNGPPGSAAPGEMGSNGMGPNSTHPYGMGSNGYGPNSAHPYGAGPGGMASRGMPSGGLPSDAYRSRGSMGPGAGPSVSGSTQPWPSGSPYGPPSGQVATTVEPNRYGSAGMSPAGTGAVRSESESGKIYTGGGSAAESHAAAHDLSPNGSSTAGGTMPALVDSGPIASSTGGSFSSTLESAKLLVEDHKLVEALQMLTQWYDNPRLSAQDNVQLNDWLERLAGTVVYSRQNLLQPAYVVQPGDRLQTIAEHHKVPWQLLAKINGIDNPNQLTPGEKLKVLRGPFMALVSLNRQEVALVVQQCYAGRFRITSMGREAAKLDGVYEVNEKLLDPVYHSPQEPPRAVAELPVHHWVGFDQKFGLRGVSDPAAPDDSRSLNLDSRDAEDVFDILSMGSRIVVRR